MVDRAADGRYPVPKRRLSGVLVLVASCCLACAPSPKRVSLSNARKVKADDGTPNDHFGISVSISGDRAIVGAYGVDDNGPQSGAAYIFRRSGRKWAQEAKLLAFGGRMNDHFGISVSIAGSTAVVGARGGIDRGAQSGAAYIFRLGAAGWEQEAKLTAAGGSSNDAFGASVSVWDNQAVVGAGGDNSRGTGAGAAYIFQHAETGWLQEAKLTARGGEARDGFGVSVSISSDRVIVGAHGDDDKGIRSGAAYVFRNNGQEWKQEVKLVAGDGNANAIFGHAVCIRGSRAIVGAHGDDDKGRRSGSAYVFRRSGTRWRLEKKLIAPGGRANDHFGVSVSISRNRLVVGARGDSGGGVKSGAAYIFRRSANRWKADAKLIARDPRTLDNLGQAVAIGKNALMVGVHGDDDRGSWSGSAYALSFGSKR